MCQCISGWVTYAEVMKHITVFLLTQCLLLCVSATAEQLDFECIGTASGQPVRVALQIIDDTAVRFSIYSAEATESIELAPVEKVKDGIRYSEMTPGIEDERVVSTRLFHFREKEQRFIFIRHRPGMLMVDANCKQSAQ